MESHALPHELVSSSQAHLGDGLYAAHFTCDGRDFRGILRKTGSHWFGGDSQTSWYGQLYGSSGALSLHFEVQAQPGTSDHPLLGTADHAVFKLDGTSTAHGARLHGEGIEGNRGQIALSLRAL